jgi:hypothetical protein
MKGGLGTVVLWVGGSVALIAILLWGFTASRGPGPPDTFAQCLADKGAIFYGAFWCSHCQNQKAMFGKSARLLPYVECSTPDGRGQLPLCTEKKIEGYPTWVFPDGSRESGEVSLARLAEKTGCTLPFSSEDAKI